jgi:hypothetical protein
MAHCQSRGMNLVCFIQELGDSSIPIVKTLLTVMEHKKYSCVRPEDTTGPPIWEKGKDRKPQLDVKGRLSFKGGGACSVTALRELGALLRGLVCVALLHATLLCSAHERAIFSVSVLRFPAGLGYELPCFFYLKRSAGGVVDGIVFERYVADIRPKKLADLYFDRVPYAVGATVRTSAMTSPAYVLFVNVHLNSDPALAVKELAHLVQHALPATLVYVGLAGLGSPLASSISCVMLCVSKSVVSCDSCRT